MGMKNDLTMKKNLIAIAAIFAIVAGCAKENLESSVVEKAERAYVSTISAVIDDETKATLDGNRMKWNEGDSIVVFSGNQPYKFTLASIEGVVATFTSETEMPVADKYYAAYPYSADAKVSNDSLYVKFPSSSAYNTVLNKAENGVNGMVATSAADDANRLVFKNAGSYLHIKADFKGETVRSITIAKSPAQVAYTFEEGTVKTKTVTNWTQLSVGFGATGKALNKIDGYIAVPPSLADSVIFTVKLLDGRMQTLVTKTEIGRNAIIDMPEFEFKEDTPLATLNGKPYYDFKNMAADLREMTEGNAEIICYQDFAFNDSLAIKGPVNVTFDLNGHDITVAGQSRIKSKVSDEAHLTMKATGGGSFKQTTSTNSPAIEFQKGTLEITGGTYAAHPKTTVYPIYVINDANLIISDGVIGAESTTHGSKGIYSATQGSITISGGTIQGDTTALYMTCSTSNTKGASLTITGGTFRTLGPKSWTVKGADGSDVTVTPKWGAINVFGTTDKLVAIDIDGCNVENPNGWSGLYMRFCNGEIKGGNYKSIRYPVRLGYAKVDPSAIRISGGYFENTANYCLTYCTSSNVTLDVSGGYFKSYGTTSPLNETGEGKTNATGGFYTTAPAEKYLAPGYVLKSDGDAPYKYYIVPGVQ